MTDAELLSLIASNPEKVIAIVKAAQAVDANTPRSMFADETDDPNCCDPYIVGRTPFRKLREALKGLK